MNSTIQFTINWPCAEYIFCIPFIIKQHLMRDPTYVSTTKQNQQTYTVLQIYKLQLILRRYQFLLALHNSKHECGEYICYQIHKFII